jgi:acetyl-CoA carboxylase carboxyl transferase subunit alpha
MKITAQDLRALEIVDEIVPEPPGGAHADHEQTFRNLDELLSRQLSELRALPGSALLEARYQKFRNLGRLGREFLDAAAG